MRYPILTDVEVDHHIRGVLPQLVTAETAYLVANGWFMRVIEDVGGEERCIVWGHETLAPLKQTGVRGVSFENAIRLARTEEGERHSTPAPAPRPTPAPVPSAESAKLQAAFTMAVRGLVEVAKNPFGSQPIQIAQNAIREVERILGRPIENEPALRGRGPNETVL